MKITSNILFVLTLILVSQAFADVGGIKQKDADGKLLAMTQGQARAFCQSKGMSLPSPRTLALLAISMGTKPIVETAYVGHGINEPIVIAEIDRNLASGYYAVLKREVSGKLSVEFYMNPQGYKPLDNNEDKAVFWSSETGTLLLGNEGVVSGPFYNWNSLLAGVRCI